jgi:transposase
MTLMNIQLGQAISDVAGVTGQKIVRAIVAGERDPQELAAYRDRRIKASEEEIAASLEGTWRAEHLFALKQALATFDFCAAQLRDCEAEIERVMQQLQRFSGEPAKGKRRGRAKNAPKFDVREHLFKMCGVDVTRVDGIDVSTALTIISETGTDLSRKRAGITFPRRDAQVRSRCLSASDAAIVPLCGRRVAWVAWSARP